MSRRLDPHIKQDTVARNESEAILRAGTPR
jgi:hypothetical protein